MKKNYSCFILFLLALPTLILAQNPVSPVLENNGNYTFSIANVKLSINPAHGARIESCTVDDQEFLYVEHKSGAEDMYGSTCWISPQNMWGWPPQAAVDVNAYSGGVDGNRLVLISGLATASSGSLKFQIVKTFTADLADTSFSIHYSIVNRSSSSKSFTCWEIMRVPTGGLTFFPVNGTVTGDLAPAFTYQDSIAWWDYDSTAGIFQKGFADGKKGWLAHADNNGFLQVKKFIDTPSNFPISGGVPIEKEIEFWAESNMYYNEIEKHGEYKTIAAGDSSTMDIKWLLRRIPDGTEINAGSPGLISLVYRILNGSSLNSETMVSESKFLLLYPNPVATTLYIQSGELKEPGTFEIYNMAGRKVMEGTTDGKILVSSLQPGLYCLRMVHEKDILSGRFLKK